MRLKKIQAFLSEHGQPFDYWESDGCGSIEFIHRGLSYHIWEYPPPERGAQSNVRNAGRQEDYDGDYEAQILKMLESWEGFH